MPNFLSSIKAEALRSLGEASIGATYTNIGTPTANPWKVFYITNTTDTDMIISINGGVTDNFVIPTKQSLSMDASANGRDNNEYLPEGTQFAVKYVAAPSTGSVYVAGVYT
jgi:hypothetical protein